jgi:hypothetical protein
MIGAGTHVQPLTVKLLINRLALFLAKFERFSRASRLRARLSRRESDGDTLSA